MKQPAKQGGLWWGVALLLVTTLAAALPKEKAASSDQGPIDNQATKATKALYYNLLNLSGKQVLFGQEDALAYGVEWKNWHKSRSDIKDVCGKHPALVGWEMSKLGQGELNIDSVNFQHMKSWMKEIYKIGGVNTLSWHMDNFVTGGDSWDVGERVVKTILPGGNHHEAYKQKLDLFADYVQSLKVGFLFKRKIPIIFRPFHEHTGGWFWWGRPHCTAEEYKTLWRFTVDYLRNEKQLNNILYCYSTDIFKDEADYLAFYPGDEYVDILGMDDYHDLSIKGKSEDLVRRLRMLVHMAEEKGKVPAFSETGQEAIPDEKWWTQRLLEPIKSDSVASRIAYMMVWRNARKDHHYGPYPDHPSAPDFQTFSEDQWLIFEGRIPDLYRFPK
ncbi:MAG: glycoside hydrolase family 26 protein [Saprospiraceae bacterium]|nr:glycoside hydrolase family 26 protein [Saprospiraceae bacterium]